MKLTQVLWCLCLLGLAIDGCATNNIIEEKAKTSYANSQEWHKNDEVVRKEVLERLVESTPHKLYRAVKFYKNNQPTGTWQWFDESNNLVREANYEYGKQHGWDRFFSADGQYFREIHYSYGVEDGMETEIRDFLKNTEFPNKIETYWERGEAIIRKFYKKGKLWQKNEVKISDSGIKTLIVQTYENGKVIKETRSFIK